jgi:dTDP-4-dehydrorhamnose reductase
VKKYPKNMQSKKILIIGSTSFLGQHLQKKYKELNKKILITDYKSLNSSTKFDLSSPSLDQLPLDKDFSHAFILGGITSLAKCEENKKSSYLINVDGILKTAKLLAEKNIKPIIISSDYVFDGQSGNYSENSKTNPLNEYGIQKEILEKKVPEITNNNYLILRLSKVIGLNINEKNFINEMLLKLLNKEKLRLIIDQKFCPIDIETLVHVITQLQDTNESGLFNICGDEKISRYDLAKIINKFISINNLIDPILSSDLKENFILPKDISMSSAKLKNLINFKCLSIEECIFKMIKQYNI